MRPNLRERRPKPAGTAGASVKTRPKVRERPPPQFPECACRNVVTSVSSTPGKAPGGMAASRCECARADGHALPSHSDVSEAGGRLQQLGSGQLDVARAVVSRPRNHFTCWYGTPMLSENC